MRSLGWTSTALAVAMLLAGSAHATQHLVRPGENWEAIDTRLKPGDEVILMSGHHRPATLENAKGTAERPITVRGLDPSNPPIIEATRYGLRLSQPQHVRIADLVVTGATINGILVEGRGTDQADDTSMAGPITISNVAVTDTGPPAKPGQRHAIHLRNVLDASLENCRTEGWVGTGLEIVACKNVRVLECAFVGKTDFVQASGVRVRAGSERIRIETCRFENTGDQGVCIGAASDPADFRPPASNRPATGPRFEASRVQVRRSVFEDSLSAVAFVHAERSFVRQCTIIRPRRAVLSVRHEQSDPSFGGIERCAFGNNLITWEPGDMAMLVHVGPNADAAPLLLEENLWWSVDIQTAIEDLGGFRCEQAFPQIVDIDPGLDESLRPQVAEAKSFGADIE